MQPFKINIPALQIDDLRTRLRNARWPGAIFRTGDEDGTSLPFVRRLADYWAQDFDWRSQEARLNELPQFVTEIDGHTVHFIYKRGTGPAPVPLILTHGWPGSFLEFERLIPLLTDPEAHGGDSRDAFDVVIPSLPGYGFSSPPEAPGISARQIAGIWRKLMHSLGYDRFFAQGGDIGAGVSSWLGADYPDAVLGLHLNYIPGSFRPPLGPGFREISEEEQAYLDRIAKFAATEGAYSLLHATKPQTLSFALSDSPVGLLAWMAEKFASWSDCQGDMESVIPIDVLLTNVSIYWFGNTIGSSLRLYKENRLQPVAAPEVSRINVPLAFAKFPKELPTPPRSWVERVFEIHRWTEMPRGGHFAALEQPELLSGDIQTSFRSLRERR